MIRGKDSKDREFYQASYQEMLLSLDRWLQQRRQEARAGIAQTERLLTDLRLLESCLRAWDWPDELREHPISGYLRQHPSATAQEVADATGYTQGRVRQVAAKAGYVLKRSSDERQ